jgi:hypothetical protein
MQIDTPLAQRVATNKHLASTLRARLRNGYPADSTFVFILDQLSDEELIAQYVAYRKGPLVPAAGQIVQLDRRETK